jgi:dienelactone hydrolase
VNKLMGLFVIILISSCSTYRTREVSYKIGKKEFKGYLAKTNLKGKRPGIIVVHEWWGQNKYARMRAELLAKSGYHALALDMYGNGKIAKHPRDAKKFAMETLKNPEDTKKRFLKAFELLTKDKDVDADNIAAIGYCFGGGVVLKMGLSGINLKAVASYHGSLSSIEKINPKGKTKILVFNGASDSFVKKSEIKSFKKKMQESNTDYKFYNYPGAMHSFTNKDADRIGRKFNLPLAYNEFADKDSWNKTMRFFEKLFH